MTNRDFQAAVLKVLTDEGIQYEQFYSDVKQWTNPREGMCLPSFEIHVYGPKLSASGGTPEHAIIQLKAEIEKRKLVAASQIDLIW